MPSQKKSGSDEKSTVAVSIDHGKQVVKVRELEISSPLVYEYFSRKNVPQNQYDETLLKAIHIGVLALMEDRIAAFLSRTENELGTNLENLKFIYQIKRETFEKASVIRGQVSEKEVLSFLLDFVKRRELGDTIKHMGDHTGSIKDNKTGDIVCEVDGQASSRIAIEVKFNQAVPLGRIREKNIYVNKPQDTAWSQLIESQINRDAKISIIVYDKSVTTDASLKNLEGVEFIKDIGFVAIIDYERNDFSNLAVAYILARDIAVHAKSVDVKDEALSFLVQRILRDLDEMLKIQSSLESLIKDSQTFAKKVETTVNGVKEEILKRQLSIQFTYEFLDRYLKDGQISRQEMFKFYSGDEVRNRYKELDLGK